MHSFVSFEYLSVDFSFDSYHFFCMVFALPSLWLLWLLLLSFILFLWFNGNVCAKACGNKYRNRCSYFQSVHTCEASVEKKRQGFVFTINILISSHHITSSNKRYVCFNTKTRSTDWCTWKRRPPVLFTIDTFREKKKTKWNTTKELYHSFVVIHFSKFVVQLLMFISRNKMNAIYLSLVFCLSLCAYGFIHTHVLILIVLFRLV